MIKLITIELKKIFKHKSIYIILLLTLLFCLLNNYIYKKDYDKNGFYKYPTTKNLNNYISKLEKTNKKYNTNEDNNKSIYINNITKISIAKVKQKYKTNDWRYLKANQYLYESNYNYNYAKYTSNDNNLINNYKKIYNNRLKKLKNNNWKYFIMEEKKELDKQKKLLEEQIKIESNIETKKQLKAEKEMINKKQHIIKYRINKNINYNNTYLNKALTEYEKNINYKKIPKTTYEEKLEYQDKISSYHINKYIIDKKININKINSLNYELRNIIDDYELFIILIILITSSIIIGEEFNKGTIKLLLIKPYKRTSILKSKLIACLIMILLTIFIIFTLNFIIGGILFGFSSLKNGVIIYNFNLHKIVKINIFIYILIKIIAKLPMFIIITLLSITLNIILNSSISSFSITMLIYTFSEVINKLAINYNLKLIRYSITLNWNYNNYLFGKLPEYKFLDFKNSILILTFYGIILTGIMFTSFNQKNIKNI